MRDFEHQHSLDGRVELISINTREGAALASLYDVVQYPSILATASDGRLLNIWQGKPLPLMDEVAGYLYS